MFSKYKHWWKLHILFLIVFAGLFLGSMIYVKHYNSQSFTQHMQDQNPDCSIIFDISKHWDELAHGYNYGMQYDGTLFNHLSVGLTNWLIEIELIPGCHLDSSWNGDFSLSGDTLTITPADYNLLILPDQNPTLGFILYSSELSCIKDYTITFYKQLHISDLLVFRLSLWALLLLLIADVIVISIAFKTRNFEKKQKISYDIINQSFLTFANMIDAKDSYTNGHSQRVAIYSRELAKRLGLSEEEQQNIYYIALLHDIGKIGIPDSVLKKKGSLTPEERRIIEQHVSIGGEILTKFTAIPHIEDGARYHHEWYNGGGYREGLSGEEIPLLARIICVADSFDAMSSARCYRPRLPLDTILRELELGTGTQFDPAIVPHMIAMIEEGAAPVILPQDEAPLLSLTSA